MISARLRISTLLATAITLNTVIGTYARGANADDIVHLVRDVPFVLANGVVTRARSFVTHVGDQPPGFPIESREILLAYMRRLDPCVIDLQLIKHEPADAVAVAADAGAARNSGEPRASSSATHVAPAAQRDHANWVLIWLFTAADAADCSVAKIPAAIDETPAARDEREVAGELSFANTPESLTRPFDVEGDMRSIAIRFPFNSSFLPPQSTKSIEALMDALSRRPMCGITLNAAVMSGEPEQVAYARWLASRRVARVKDMLDHHLDFEKIAYSWQFEPDNNRRTVKLLIKSGEDCRDTDDTDRTNGPSATSSPSVHTASANEGASHDASR